MYVYDDITVHTLIFGVYIIMCVFYVCAHTSTEGNHNYIVKLSG